jgi:hypothetical protein
VSEPVLPMTDCCNGTRYADYAAVLCPEPNCPAAMSLMQQETSSRGYNIRSPYSSSTIFLVADDD